MPIRQNHNGRGASKLSADFCRQKYHRIAFAASLGVPENAQLTVPQLSRLVGFDGLVDTQVLVIPSKNFDRPIIGVVIKDEVFQQMRGVQPLPHSEIPPLCGGGGGSRAARPPSEHRTARRGDPPGIL